MKSESFLKGTVILISANAVSKILGATLKIPLTYILGEEGMAIYQTAFSVYIMLLSFITSGFPLALSKYIAEENAKQRLGNIRCAVHISMVIMSIAGVILSTVMFFGADFFALAMKDPKSPLAIRAIAPAILLVAVGAVYKSCYQGFSHMTPTAVSQVLEAFIKLIAGYFLAVMFSAFSVYYSSASAIFGVTAGEAFATLILFLLFMPYRRELSKTLCDSPRCDILKSLFSVAIPLTATSVISGSLSLFETSVIRNRLASLTFTPSSAELFLNMYSKYTNIFGEILKTGHMSFDGARWLFGAYSGYAMTVFNLPIGILSSFCVSILPVITRCITLGDKTRLNGCISATLRINLIISAPCAILLSLFSNQILQILFRNTASALILSCTAPLIIVICISQIISSVQYALGEVMTPFYYTLTALFVKILLSYILIAIPELNIFGAVIASYAANILQLFLNFRSVKQKTCIKFPPISSIAKILSSAATAGFFALLIYSPIFDIFQNTFISFFLTALLCIAVYLLLILLVGALKKEELVSLKTSNF